MRVDRLSFEMTMRGAGYCLHVTAWDGLKGRLTHIGTYEGMSFNELDDVLTATLDRYRPGTEFWLHEDQVYFQAPLFD